MQLRREKHSLTKHDKNKDFGRMKRKWKKRTSLGCCYGKQCLWQGSEGVGAAGVASVGRWSEGVTRSQEERVIHQGHPQRDCGPWGPTLEHRGVRSKECTEEFLHTDPEPLHCPFSLTEGTECNHWLWYQERGEEPGVMLSLTLLLRRH